MLLDLTPLELNSAYMGIFSFELIAWNRLILILVHGFYFLEKLQSEKIVRMRKLLGRFSSISDFSVEGDIILTANDDESISVKTLQF